jgi:hypothetical protein
MAETSNGSDRTGGSSGGKVPKVTPLDGITTIDDKMTFEPERLSYASARAVAAFIAGEIREQLGARPLVIADDGFVSDLGNLGAARLQLEMLADDYNRVTASVSAASGPEPAVAGVEPAVVGSGVAVAAIAGGLQTALGLVSLLRENVEFRGVVTRIDPLAFEIGLASALREEGIEKVYVPGLIVVQKPLDEPGSLHTRLKQVQAARHAAWQAAGPLLAELGRKDAAMDAASRTGAPEQVTALAREVFELRRSVEPLTETLSSADRRFNELQAQWDKPSEATGLTMIARLLRAETLDAQTPRYLHAAVVSSGGHNRVSRSLFNTLFGGDRLSSLGGVVVRWALLEADGVFQKGGVQAERRIAAFPPARDTTTDAQT